MQKTLVFLPLQFTQGCWTSHPSPGLLFRPIAQRHKLAFLPPKWGCARSTAIIFCASSSPKHPLFRPIMIKPSEIVRTEVIRNAASFREIEKEMNE
jgi:hypothetical protein